MSAGLRRHWLIATLLAVAAVIRILVMVAYVPAFWYFGDSGEYIQLSQDLRPHPLRPLGFPVLLKLMSVTGTHVVVIGLHHLLGLGLGAGIYALLLRRGLPRRVASLAAVPVLFDSLQIDLEHFLLAETLFSVLLAAGIGTALWWDRPGLNALAARPGPLACAGSGLLLAGAWFTRPIGLSVAILVGLYLVLRRLSWRALVAFAVAFAVPWAAVLLWVGDRPSSYDRGATSLFLYGRTAMIADCDHLVLPPEEQAVCPVTPIDPQLAGRADWYIWVYLPPEVVNDPAKAPVLQGFAIDVIKQQPGDYLAIVARESAPYFVPWQDLGPGQDVVNQWWTLPASVRDSGGVPVLAGPGLAVFPIEPAQSPGPTGLTRVLHWYGLYVRTPPVFTSAVVIATLVALVLAVRRRRTHARAWPPARDAGMLAGIGVAALVAQVALSMYEPRYGMPILPLFSVAAALAWQALQAARAAADPAIDQGVAGRAGAGPSSSNESK